MWPGVVLAGWRRSALHRTSRAMAMRVSPSALLHAAVYLPASLLVTFQISSSSSPLRRYRGYPSVTGHTHARVTPHRHLRKSVSHRELFNGRTERARGA